MKKLLFLLTAFFVVSFVMAQNAATVNQTGDNGKASVSQSGNLNNAVVTQVESALNLPSGVQIATVKQTGTSNEATVSQTETGAGGHTTNSAFIEQIGYKNKSIQSTYAPGYNSGQNVWGYQKGNENTLKQTWNAGYTNSFNASMTGDRNDVEQGWSANHSHGYVTITGSDNIAKQGLYGNNAGYYIGIKIDQNGNWNSAIQDFKGGAQGHNDAGIISQTNDHNEATQFVDGYDVYAQIVQDGNSNKAYQTINGNSNYVPNTVYPNNFYNVKYIKIQQSGDDNRASQTIFGNQNQADFTQLGNRNIANSLQNGNLSTLLILQNGDDNIVGGIDATSNITDLAIFNNNASMNATQLGDNNKLYINTSGALTSVQDNRGTSVVGNVIKYTQTGLGNASLSQIGDKDLIWLTNSSASSPSIDIAQTGDDNVVASFDNGFASSVSGPALFQGSSLNVDQNGIGNLLHLNSIDPLGAVTVNQNGTQNLASVIQK